MIEYASQNQTQYLSRYLKNHCFLQEVAAAGWRVWSGNAGDGGQPCQQEAGHVGNHSWRKGRGFPFEALIFFTSSYDWPFVICLSHRDCRRLKRFLRDPHCSSFCVGQVTLAASPQPPLPSRLLPATRTAVAPWRQGPAITELPSWVSTNPPQV